MGVWSHWGRGRSAFVRSVFQKYSVDVFLLVERDSALILISLHSHAEKECALPKILHIKVFVD